MFKRHPWFTFYTFSLGLVVDLIGLIVSLCVKNTNAIFICSLIVALVYLFLFIWFANTGVRKRFYEKDDSNSNDFKKISLITFGVFALICIIVCILGFTVFK